MIYSQQNQWNNTNSLNQYLVKEIMDASPEELLIKVYDFAIAKANQHNLEKTNKAIQLLIDSLNFDHSPEVSRISMGLLRLYKFCQDQSRENKFELTIKILTELRSSWRESSK